MEALGRLRSLLRTLPSLPQLPSPGAPHFPQTPATIGPKPLTPGLAGKVRDAELIFIVTTPHKETSPALTCWV